MNNELEQLSETIKTTTSVELHVEEFGKVKDFYTSLGFQIIFENSGIYLVMRLGGAILNFWGDGGRFPSQQPYFKNFPHNTKKGYAIEIIIPVEDIEQFFLKAKENVRVIEELQLQPWGARDFRIEDPNGFYIRFTEPHDWIFGKGV